MEKSPKLKIMLKKEGNIIADAKKTYPNLLTNHIPGIRG
jgi:hypothetical protein